MAARAETGKAGVCDREEVADVEWAAGVAKGEVVRAGAARWIMAPCAC